MFNTPSFKSSIILFVFLCSSIFTFSQVDTSSLSEIDKKIVNTFKQQYVEKTFKDPYSFQLLKIESKPVTFGGWLLNDISYLKSSLERKDFIVYKKNELEEKIKKYEDEYSTMSEDVRKTVKSYEVKLDCYGSNSYGGKILGRYSFNYVVLDKDLKPVDYSTNKLYVSVIK